MPNHDEPLQRWQGRVDAFLDTVPKQIETLFKAIDVAEKATQLVDDELSKEMKECYAQLKKEVTEVATKLSNLTSKLAVIVALGSFVGTVVTSLLVAAMIKIFLK